MRRTETRSQRALRLEGDTPKCLAFEPRPFVISLVFGSSLPSRTETLSHTLALLLVCSEPGWPLLTVVLGSALPAPPSRLAPLIGEAVVHEHRPGGLNSRSILSTFQSLILGWHMEGCSILRPLCRRLVPAGIILIFPCLHWPPVPRVSSSCKGASHWTESPLISRMIALQEPYLIVPGETFFPRKVTR